MAQKTDVRLIDDLDGSEAEGTVTFGFEGKSYEMELSKANEENLRQILEPYITAARRAAGARGGLGGQKAGARRSVSTHALGDLAAMRAWARERGMKVSDRGRVPKMIAQEFLAAKERGEV
jgi:hypothetical protein